MIEDIRRVCPAKLIYLISQKIDISGELLSFKLCVVAEDSIGSVSETEQRLYMQIDCGISYDLILYTVSEWERLKGDIGSFAWKINETGRLLYER